MIPTIRMLACQQVTKRLVSATLTRLEVSQSALIEVDLLLWEIEFPQRSLDLYGIIVATF